MTAVLIDTSFIAYQAMSKLKNLATDETCTGVVYGVFTRLLSIATRFRTNDFHFCFDGNSSEGVRKELEPSYKGNREKKTPEEAEEHRLLYCQLAILKDFLEAIGWPCYYERRFESDDLLAALSMQMRRDREVCIVSDDGDLHQLLGHPHVFMFNPTKHTITRERDLPYKACEVADLKAIGGCESDAVKGVPGVAKVRALQYIRRTYNRVAVPAWVASIEANKSKIDKNRVLVTLPHPALPSVTVKEAHLNIDQFYSMCGELDFESFTHPPFSLKWDWLFSGEIDRLVSEDKRAPMGRVSQRRRQPADVSEGFGL